MRVKVRGGTVQYGQPSLCVTCRSATIVKGQRLRDDIIECRQLGARVTFAVSACNQYIDATHPTVREMEDVAWVLRSDPRRNQVGFVPAKQLKPHDRYVLPDEWD
jgi:hypothetical protein